MPVTLPPTIVAPLLVVVAAATLVIAAWVLVGLVNPGTVNAMTLPALNVPAVNAMVKTKGPVPDKAEAPAAPDEGAVKERVPEPLSAKPAPLSVMTILPSGATAVAGVSVTLMVTPVAPFATLLRVIAGEAIPSEIMDGATFCCVPDCADVESSKTPAA